ncbi:hypothetical protein, partial [Rubrimonas sp.]|uniref:hypothetical protein n=1 Tax=Rubrimonas sp. TaxID=2036015 RepID=UPI002FDD17B6
AAETGGERLVGDAGDDTYLVWFDEGEVIVDERGFGALQGAADWLGDRIPGLDQILPTGGGDDVIEIRRYGIVDIDAFDFTLTREASDLVIGFEDSFFGDEIGSVRVVGMDTTAGRVETLRLVNGSESFHFDIAAAFDAAALGDVELADFALTSYAGAARQGRDALDMLDDAVGTMGLFANAGNSVSKLLSDGAAAATHAIGLDVPTDHLLYA